MKNSIKIDHLDQPISIEEKIYEKDGQGGFLEVWKEVGTTWAAILPSISVTELEVWRTGEHCFRSRYRIWVRGLPGYLKSSLRFRWYEEVFEAVGMPQYVQNRRFQTILMEKVEEEKRSG